MKTNFGNNRIPKICQVCNKEKSKREFGFDNRMSDGRKKFCIKCQRDYNLGIIKGAREVDKEDFNNINGDAIYC